MTRISTPRYTCWTIRRKSWPVRAGRLFPTPRSGKPVAAARRGVVNIFAGIPADKTAAIDLDAYVDKQLYFIGTSGSEMKDMQQVLAKVTAGELDTNLSVAAVAGLEGAIDGIRAVEKNLLPGKVLVYPSCRGLKLTALGEVEGAASVRWDAEAEAALLKRYAKS